MKLFIKDFSNVFSIHMTSNLGSESLLPQVQQKHVIYICMNYLARVRRTFVEWVIPGKIKTGV